MLTQEQYDHFTQFLPTDINPSLKEAFRQNATVIELQKGETLFNENPNNPKTYYILKGSCVRFIVTPEGNERAIMFHTESFIPVIGGTHINSENSWVNYSIIANETTSLIEFDTSIGFEWYKKDTAFALFIYQRNIEYLSIINQLQNHLIGLTSEEFFQWLMEKYSFIFQRFMSKDIASFMGVTPVWFSTIKAKLSKK